MAYHFRNLIFEGGGVKGIAYVGATQVLAEKGILENIGRVGGTSAGAINAALFALGFSVDEQRRILTEMSFENFLDDSWGILRDTNRLIEKFGWYKGQFFHKWIRTRIEEKLENPDATFRMLEAAGRPRLYVYGTNLSTRFGEVFSVEHTPDMRIADAVRISMSIPLFFTAVRNAREDVYVDGGVLNNYPVKLFDREKYVEQAEAARRTPYYDAENKRFLALHPHRSPYVYNKETLGFRLDSKQEIAMFRYGAEPAHQEVDDFFDYLKALVSTVLEIQLNTHLHGDDWHRTVYIDTLGVGTTEFDLSEKKKAALEASGREGATKYFQWYDKEGSEPVNRL